LLSKTGPVQSLGKVISRRTHWRETKNESPFGGL
jgi:hypothetical protein